MVKRFIPRLHGLPLTALSDKSFDDLDSAINAVLDVVDSRYDKSLCKITYHPQYPTQWATIDFPAFEEFSYPIRVEIKGN